MEIRNLSINGAWEFTPVQYKDSRGLFLEACRSLLVSEVIGHEFKLAQMNMSVSSEGALRGVHFADVPPGQAKYVTCTAGVVLDVIVDLRVGSPTFGYHDTVVLDDIDRRAVYLSEGLGHGFCSLADGSTVVYVCSTEYNPDAEHGIYPLDAQLRIDWPTTGRSGKSLAYELSDKDSAAPSLAEAVASGLLPDYAKIMSSLQGVSAQ